MSFERGSGPKIFISQFDGTPMSFPDPRKRTDVVVFLDTPEMAYAQESIAQRGRVGFDVSLAVSNDVVRALERALGEARAMLRESARAVVECGPGRRVVERGDGTVLVETPDGVYGEPSE